MRITGRPTAICLRDMPVSGITDRARIATTLGTLALAAMAWFLGNHIQTTQPFTMTFQPSGGTATIKFGAQRWANSPICSCNEAWRGIDFPVNQFDVGVSNGHPWSLMVGPMDHSVPANWWQDPQSGFMSTFSLTVKDGKKTIYRIKDAAAGITVESPGPKIGIYTRDSQFSAVMPANGSTTKLHSEPAQLDGAPGAFVSMAVSSPAVPSQQSDYIQSDGYVKDPERVGSNFRATMIDTLGPKIDISLGANVQPESGRFRLWVGMREVKLPTRGNVDISIRTDFAIRMRPLPFDHESIVGDNVAGVRAIPVVSRSIPADTVTFDNAVSFGGKSWSNFVKMETTGGGAPITLPTTPMLSVYGMLTTIDANSLVGTVLAPNSIDISQGDELQLESKNGFDFTQKPIALLSATSEGIVDSQYLHGRATGRLEPADTAGGIDGLLDRITGPLVTKTHWLIRLAQVLATVAGTITCWELFQVFLKHNRVPQRASQIAKPTGSTWSAPKGTRNNKVNGRRPKTKTSRNRR